jgi:stearoyl-CoA desaturase (delta-9 desaturase)
VTFQHKHYIPLAILSGIVVPTLIAGFGWGDWLGGYFYAGLAKMFIVHQSTFFINSLAHLNMDLFNSK